MRCGVVSKAVAEIDNAFGGRKWKEWWMDAEATVRRGSGRMGNGNLKGFNTMGQLVFIITRAGICDATASNECIRYLLCVFWVIIQHCTIRSLLIVIAPTRIRILH